MIKGVLATDEEIPAVGKLGQYDQVRSTVCRFGRQCKTLTQIVGSVVYANLRVQLDDGYACGACWFAPGGDLLLLYNRDSVGRL